MEGIHFIIIGIAVFQVVLLVLFIKSRKKGEETISTRDTRKANKRENYRLRLDLEDAFLEVKKVGDRIENDSEVCEIVDISASGMAIYSNMDYPIRQKVMVKLYFKLNYREFAFDGTIIRKVELSNKQKIQYGIKFINLSEGDENRLLKEIAAIDNSRRKIPIR